MVERELGRILDGDHALAVGHIGGQRIEQRRLARAGAAADEDIAARLDGSLEQLVELGAHGAKALQVRGRQRVLAELADRHHRAGQRQRGNHHVDAAAIRQARIDHGIGFIQPPPDRRQDAAHDAQQVPAIGKAHGNALQHAVPGYVDVQVPIDQDVFHRRVIEQVLDRAEARQLLGQCLGDLVQLGLVDGDAAQPREALQLQVDKAVDRGARPAAKFRAQLLDAGEQVLMGRFLDVLEFLRSRKRRGGVIGEFDGLRHVSSQPAQCVSRAWRVALRAVFLLPGSASQLRLQCRHGIPADPPTGQRHGHRDRRGCRRPAPRHG